MRGEKAAREGRKKEDLYTSERRRETETCKREGEREANEKERETCMWKKLSGKKSEDEKQADSWQAEGKRDKTNGRKRDKQRGRKQREERQGVRPHRTDEENEQRRKGDMQREREDATNGRQQ